MGIYTEGGERERMIKGGIESDFRDLEGMGCRLIELEKERKRNEEREGREIEIERVR